MKYCIPALNPYYRKDIDILGEKSRESHQNGRLELTTQDERRKHGDLIEIYKIITDKENVQRDRFFFSKRLIVITTEEGAIL